MGFLLDTVTLSELRKKRKADPRVLAWQSMNRGPGYLSVITLNEIRYGIRRVQTSDEVFAERLEVWYRDILRANDLFVIIPVDRRIAETAADLRYDFKMSYEDSMIAGTARVHSLTLATRNSQDFIDCGIAWVNPWTCEN